MSKQERSFVVPANANVHTTTATLGERTQVRAKRRGGARVNSRVCTWWIPRCTSQPYLFALFLL